MTRALDSAVRALVDLERRRLAALFGVEIVGRPGTARSLACLAARCPVGFFGGLVPTGLHLVVSLPEVLDGDDLGIVPVGLALVYRSVRETAGPVGMESRLDRRLLGPSRQDPQGPLTERERDVMDLLAQGHTDPAIAARLFVSQSAVEKHAVAIFDELDLGDTAGYGRRVLAVLRHIGT